ncbi:MAG: hypothetical protein LLF95_03640 [Bacteroidales bacterium]|nr:hypothetical protein [Bacteroidales bacterium]
MSIQYKMIRKGDNLNPEGQKKVAYHPQVVRADTVKLKKLCSHAAGSKSRNALELEISMRILIEQIETELCNSNSVCIDGFGTFSLTAESRPVNDPDEIRAESISVKRVAFTTSKMFMSRLRESKFVRAKDR